jgi:hypothetical protein
MAICAKEILNIATDGRYRPETRGKRIALALGLTNDEADALEQAFIEQHEWTINRLKDEPEPEEPSNAAIALLEKRSKDWLREHDTDMTGDAATDFGQPPIRHLPKGEAPHHR